MCLYKTPANCLFYRGGVWTDHVTPIKQSEGTTNSIPEEYKYTKIP